MITVDTERTIGPVKAVNGVNLGPIDSHWARDFGTWFRAAGISSVRLHDAPLKVADVADLHTIFPNPDADPDDPANYRFELTDAYLRTIVACGAEIYFRLGESIDHTPYKRFIRPELWTPESMARVCANIARHYTQGWADGQHWPIRYWEFWNEPELRWNQPSETRQMWTGTPDQFLEFYRAVAPAVKAVDPGLQVGLAGFTRALFLAGPDEPGHVPGWSELVGRCVDAGLPVDFVSWHRYGRSWVELADLITRTREYLDRLGLTEAESHLTEWHYLPELHDADGPYTFMNSRLTGNFDRIERSFTSITDVATAAFTFGVFAQSQYLPLDLAHHYVGVSGNFGLFALSGRPNDAYQAFVAFGRFLDPDVSGLLPVQVDPAIDPDRVTAMAVRTETSVRVGIAHLRGEPTRMPVRAGGELRSARRFDDAGWHDLDLQRDRAGSITVEFDGPGITILDLTA